MSVFPAFDLNIFTQLPPTKVGGLSFRPPPTISGETVADSVKPYSLNIWWNLLVVVSKSSSFPQRRVSRVCKQLTNQLLLDTRLRGNDVNFHC